MDTTKGIALTSGGRAVVWELMMNRRRSKGPSAHHPGTDGSRYGFGIESCAVVTNWESHIEMALNGIPCFIYVKLPSSTRAINLDRTDACKFKAGGFDIISHLIEYYLTDTTPVP